MISERLTFRLTPTLRGLLRDRCVQTGQAASKVVREALEHALVPKTASAEDSEGQIAPGREFPAGLAPFLVSAQQAGDSAWRELRIQFCSVLALSEVARQISKNPLDEALCKELLRIGIEFNLLPGSEC